MPTNTARFQSGQAMTELVIAMLVALPLVLGVIYVGKYEDLKHSAIQASRYTAFERVYDPWAAHKSDQVLAEETRARFFTDPMRSNNGAVAFQDSTQNLQPKGTLNWNWYGTDGAPIVSQYAANSNNTAGIDVTVQKGSVSAAAYSGLQKLADPGSFKIPDPGIAQAHVRVSLAPVVNFGPLNRNLTIDASTAVLTDGYNASGGGVRGGSSAPNSVRARVFNDWGIVFGKIPGMKTFLSALDSGIAAWGWQAVSDTNGPQWGCVSPDVVPTDVAPGANYDPTNPNTNC
jgi:hypothetical protein